MQLRNFFWDLWRSINHKKVVGRKKVGLLLISTGKYDVFINPLIESAEKWFLKNHDVTYFLFTDTTLQFDNPKIVKIPHEHKPFPYPTLFRYNTFVKNEKYLEGMDYLFYSDIDMLFVDEVGDEILSDRVFTQHPGYYGKRGTPETNPASLAFVSRKEKMQYFAGGFNGGTREEFMKMAKVIDKNIQKDLENNVIAIWHDESHLNRYAINNRPTKVLSPSYCYGESMNIPFKKRLLALDKNHAEIRS
jgi:histo-blood group ABO system transferase